MRHLEMQTCFDKVSGQLGAPNRFLPGWIVLCVHFHPFTTPLRSKTFHLPVPASLLARQSSPQKEESDPGEKRCVGNGNLFLRSENPMILRVGGKRSHQGRETSSCGRDDGMERGICGPARERWLWFYEEEKGRNLDLCLSPLGFNGFSG